MKVIAMTPQEEFENWYLNAVGITVQKATRIGVYDLRLMRKAFMAGREAGRMAKDKHIPPSVKEFWSETIKEEKRLREGGEE